MMDNDINWSRMCRLLSLGEAKQIDLEGDNIFRSTPLRQPSPPSAHGTGNLHSSIQSRQTASPKEGIRMFSEYRQPIVQLYQLNRDPPP